MITKDGGSTNKIFGLIEELYLNQIGPIAVVITQEALQAWVEDLKSKNEKPSLRNISGYIERLATEITDLADRRAFVDAVYEIQALSHYKHHYTGNLK